MKVKFPCGHCGKTARQERGAVNRARRTGMRLFCGRRCAGLARRSGKTKTQRVAEKSAYDREYRAKNLEAIKAKKRAHHLRTYDPVKAARERKRKMARHVAYCRQPEYRAKKHEYDRRRYAEQFGPFAECVGLLQELNAEIASRMSRYDIYMANGRFEKYYAKRKQRRLASVEGYQRG